jgi:hypothetical protein
MRIFAVLVLILAACDAASSDYPTVIEARSAAAEWAKVNQLATQHRVTATYTRTMREEARRQLSKAAASLSDPGSPQASEVRALIALPDDASSEELSAHVDALQKIEDRLAVS